VSYLYPYLFTYFIDINIYVLLNYASAKPIMCFIAFIFFLTWF